MKILSPYKNEFFEDEWGNKFVNKHIPTVGWDKWGTPLVEGTGFFFRLLTSVRLRGYSIEYPNGSLQTMELSKPNNLAWLFSWILIKLFPRESKRRKLLRVIYDRLGSTNKTMAESFYPEKSDLLVTSTMGHFPMDFIGLTMARKYSIRTMCILLSWDNLYSRGPVYKHPTKLLVWSKIMKKQALNIHQFQDHEVGVVGPLQFVNYAEQLSQEELLTLRRKFSLMDSDKYVLYVCGGRTPQYDLEDIKILVKTLKASEYKDHKIIVRPHPQIDAKYYYQVKDLVYLDYSPSLIGVGDPAKLFERNDIRHFAALLVQADYVVSSWGTTALLEACIFDKKVVQLNWYDSVPHDDVIQKNSVRNFQRYYHMQEFDQYEGRLFSYEPSDLISKFRELSDKDDRFSENRNKIRTDFTIGEYSQVVPAITNEIELTCNQ